MLQLIGMEFFELGPCATLFTQRSYALMKAVTSSLQKFKFWAGEAGVVLHAEGVKRASSMGLGELIHHHLRRSFLKLKSENPKISDEIFLDVALKAHTDFSGLNGLVPTLLVFGAFPRFPVRTGAEDMPLNTARARMRQIAPREQIF